MTSKYISGTHASGRPCSSVHCSALVGALAVIRTELDSRYRQSFTIFNLRGAMGHAKRIVPRLTTMIQELNVIAAAVFTALLVLCPVQVAAAAEAGKVMTFNGDCFVVVDQQRKALKMGDVVHVGVVLDVPAGAKLKLLMSDGSVLSLAAGTRMTIKNYDVDASGERRDAQLSLDTGLMRAVVSKISEPSKFEVKTATSVAAARSTDWFVEAAPETTTVSVLDGAVAVTRLADKPGNVQGNILLTSHSASTIGPGKDRLRPIPWTPAEFTRLIDRTSVRFGWCQCISDRKTIRAACLSSQERCEANCTERSYSYIPDAPQSCAALYGEAVVRIQRR